MRAVLLVALVACGRVEFDPVSGAGDDGGHLDDGGRGDGLLAPDVSLASLNRVFCRAPGGRASTASRSQTVRSVR